MPNMAAWLGGTRFDDSWKAGDTAARINERPTTLTVLRGQSTHTVTVRIEPTRSGDERQTDGPTATIGSSGVVVIGFRNHPNVADTNLKRGDRFLWEGDRYEVTLVNHSYRYRLLAVAEVTT